LFKAFKNRPGTHQVSGDFSRARVSGEIEIWRNWENNGFFKAFQATIFLRKI